MLKKISIIFLVLAFLTISLQNLDKYSDLYAADEEVTEKEIDDLKEEIKEKSKAIKTNENTIQDLENQIKINEEAQVTINDSISDIQKDITIREGTITTYLIFMQKIVNQNIWLKSIEGENFLEYIYNLNKVINYINNDFLSLQKKISELEETQAVYEVTVQNLMKDKESLEEETNKLNKVYKDLNEELVELEKEIHYEIDYDQSALVAKEDREKLMKNVGIKEDDFEYVDYIVANESSWNYKVENPYSGAYGLCQSLPPEKMASAGSDWQTNPETQLTWCDGYANARYGSWAQAKTFWEENNWW